MEYFFLQSMLYHLTLVYDLHQELKLTYTQELISTPKIITLQPNPLPTEKVPFLSNPIQYLQYF